MTQPLKVTGNTAIPITKVVVGNATYRVTVTVEPIQGGTINQADAEVAMTEAMHEFPQRTRSGP
jgi:hypothetical protein